MAIELHPRELWAGESITYGCIDPAEGIDGGDSTTVSFPCRTLTVPANGSYAVPDKDKGEPWPTCRKRTTTIKPRESEQSDKFAHGEYLFLLLTCGIVPGGLDTNLILMSAKCFYLATFVTLYLIKLSKSSLAHLP